jgi:PAS domain S-box-containing protein
VGAVVAGLGLPGAILATWASGLVAARQLAVWGLPASAAAAAACALGVIVLQARERRALEQRLRTLEASAAALFSALPDGLAVVRHREVVAVNERLCELLGHPAGALVGAAYPFPHVAPEHRHELEAWVATLQEEGYAEGTLVLCDAAGGRVAVEAAGRAVDESDGLGPGHVVTVRDVSASRRHVARVTALATYDPQTGLLNQRGFQERLAEEVRRAGLSGESLSVALLAVNETFAESDLADAIHAIATQVRVEEHLARTRDDEIAWILCNTDSAGASAAVARLRTDLARGAAALEARGFQLTAGICDLDAAEDAASLYALAGRALAHAVRTRAGTTECYTPLTLTTGA